MNRKTLLNLIIVWLVVTPTAYAGPRFKLDEIRWLSVGMGLRSSFNSIENAPTIGGATQDIEIDNFRIFINGAVHRWIAFEVNTDRDQSVNDIQLLDGTVKLEPAGAFHLWGGRQRVPINRSMLNPIFSLITWDRLVLLQFPNKFQGRDDGASLWGTVAGERLKYYATVFDGAPDEDNDLLFAGRLVYNVLNPEPEHTTQGSYHGTKRVLSVGASYLREQGDDAWTADLFLERHLGVPGITTVEAGVFRYNGLADSNNIPVDGEGYHVLGAHLLPELLWIGRVQLYFRYQDGAFNRMNGTRFDLGVNYLVDGHNARINLQWTRDHGLGNPVSGTDIIHIGLQVQI